MSGLCNYCVDASSNVSFDQVWSPACVCQAQTPLLRSLFNFQIQQSFLTPGISKLFSTVSISQIFNNNDDNKNSSNTTPTKSHTYKDQPHSDSEPITWQQLFQVEKPRQFFQDVLGVSSQCISARHRTAYNITK